MLLSIEAQFIYRDLYSFEARTHHSKIKNKLAGYRPRALEALNQYIFFVLTSSGASTSKHRRILIDRDADLEWKCEQFAESGYMVDREGYCDLADYEFLTGDDLTAKIKRSSIGFLKIAKLCLSKWEELQTLARDYRVRSRIPGTSMQLQRYLIEATTPSAQTDMILAKLRLN